MARCLLVVLAALYVVQCVKASCDSAVIDKVKAKTAGQNKAETLSKIAGAYNFKIASAAFDDSCLTAAFDGSTVDFSGVAEGQYTINVKDNDLVASDDEGDKWVLYILGSTENAVTLVACSIDKDETVSFEGVAANQKALSSAATDADVAKGKDLLTEVGFTDLVELKACS